MEDYIIKHTSIIEKLGISKNIFCVVVLIILLPSFVPIYLRDFQLLFYYLIFLVFILVINTFILLPSFLRMDYKLKITSDEIAFYSYSLSPGGIWSRFVNRHVQFSDIKNYTIENHSLILCYKHSFGLGNAIEKVKIRNLSPEECSRISDILLEKIGDKHNSGFKQSLLAWLWQDIRSTILLAMLITICLALLIKFVQSFLI